MKGLTRRASWLLVDDKFIRQRRRSCFVVCTLLWGYSDASVSYVTIQLSNDNLPTASTHSSSGCYLSVTGASFAQMIVMTRRDEVIIPTRIVNTEVHMQHAPVTCANYVTGALSPGTVQLVIPLVIASLVLIAVAAVLYCRRRRA